MARYFWLVICLLGVLAAFGQEAPAMPVALSGTVHCTALEPLAAWLGATVSWSQAKDSVKVAFGSRSVALQPGNVVATNAYGRIYCLPAAPFNLQGALYVPTRALVEALGDSAMISPDGEVTITHQRRTLTLEPPVPTAPAATPLERTVQSLQDARITPDAYLKSNDLLTQLRNGVDVFIKFAQPVQPSLQAIADSKPLKLLTHVPVVGSLIGVCQDSVGAINTTITTTRQLVEWDRETNAPVRDAMQAVKAVMAAPDAATIVANRPKWSTALAAIEKQQTMYANVATRLQGLVGTLNLVDAKMAEFRKSYPQTQYVLTLAPLCRSTQDLGVLVEANRWRLGAVKEYFTKLAQESAGVQ